jgi:hypothetical protein
MVTESVLDRADWSRRSAEFGVLHEHSDPYHGRLVVMELEPTEPKAASEWLRLCDRWLELPKYPNVLRPLGRGDGAKLLLRYAALDWNREPLDLQTSPRARIVANWGVQLTDVLRRIWDDRPNEDATLFLRPLIKIDLEGDLRIGFLPVVRGDPRLPPELRKWNPRADERTAMYVVGRAIAEVCVGLDTREAVAVKAIVERCLQPKPYRRYKSMDELYRAWCNLPGANLSVEPSWTEIEVGIGWLQFGSPERALECFTSALRANPRAYLAEAGRQRASIALGIDPAPPPRSHEPTASPG